MNVKVAVVGLMILSGAAAEDGALLREPLPAGVQAAGPTVLYRQNLYEYIDGAAELFHSFGLEVLTHREFKAGDVELTADVYDMGTAENAFGAYAAERSPGYRFITIGAEGYEDENILNFLDGRYYVKLAAFGDGAKPALEQFARHLTTRIGGAGSLPEFLGRFPAEGRKERSEGYVRLAPMGHPFLGPAYTAKYEWNGRASTVLISIADDAADARRRLEQLAGHLRQTGQLDTEKPDMVRGGNSFEGTMLAKAEARYLAVVLNSGPGSEALLDAVCSRLR